MRKQIGFEGMDNSDSSDKGDFNPPDRPQSAGVQRTKDRDSKPDQVVQPHAAASMSNDAPVSVESFQNLLVLQVKIIIDNLFHIMIGH